MKEKPIRKAGGYEPQRNLPQFDWRRSAENRFALRFARAYRAGLDSLPDHCEGDAMAFAREIPANGYGIADIVSLTWKGSPTGRQGAYHSAEDLASGVAHILRAFELKISDWRKALQQASRYRFFTHVPIAVLHIDNSRGALKNLKSFRVLGVGLWTFDPQKNAIASHFTPPPVHPRDTRHHFRTLRLMAKVTKALPVA